MGTYNATVQWQNEGVDITQRKYSRRHLWQFDGGIDVVASASPQIVPLPYSDAAAVDPEEALVAAVASCHMLFFLDFASGEGFNIKTYFDEAVGYMAKNSQGRIAMSKISLQPQIEYIGDAPSAEQLQALHDKAHQHCFIANSLKTTVEVVV